jgi:DNA gyrase subunit A
MVVTLSHTGYIKSQPLADYRAQRRGGRGKQAAAMKADDFVDHLFVANTHDFILCFTNRGRVYWLKVYEVPQGTRTSRGKPIVNLFPFEDGEKISAILPVKEFADDRYIFMCTANGTVKKTPLSDFSNPRKAGIIAVALDEDDVLIGAEITNGLQDVVLVSDAGKAVWFDEEDVRPMGRTARGVRGMRLGRPATGVVAAGCRQRSANGAGGHRERFRQTHGVRRFPPFRSRYAGGQSHCRQRTQRQGRCRPPGA